MDIFEHLKDILKAQDETQTSLNSAVAALDTDCASVTILENGKISATTLSASSKSSYNNETIFQACSISKAITALGVIKLVQEGKLDLDASITKYLSASQLDLISTPHTQKHISLITLRLLLSHSSGLSVGGFVGYNPSRSIPDIEQTLSGTSPANNPQIHLIDIPGRKFSYSGGGFTVIQLILETVFKKPFNELLTEIVLKPLNMNRSFYSALPNDEKNFAPAYRTAYTTADAIQHIVPELAAAGLWTTPTDLLKASAAVQASLAGAPNAFLTESWAREILTPPEKDRGWGLGWMISKDAISFGHGGSNDPGYRCHLLGYSPTLGKEDDAAGEDCGICVMTNSHLGYEAAVRIIWAISYIKGWPLAVEYSDVAPLVDRSADIGDDWKAFKGNSWGEWEILEGKSGGPAVKWKGGEDVNLLKAAKPTKKGELVFVAEGLSLGFRLSSKDGEKKVELLEGMKATELHSKDQKHD